MFDKKYIQYLYEEICRYNDQEFLEDVHGITNAEELEDYIYAQIVSNLEYDFGVDVDSSKLFNPATFERK